MAPQHVANDDILRVILATLHRLETRFNDQDHRLSSIELTLLPGAGVISPAERPEQVCSTTSCGCSCVLPPQPLFQGLRGVNSEDEHPTASAYMASMDKLRSRFEFDDHSELDVGSAGGSGPRMNTKRSQELDGMLDCYSVSVYPSRPLSRLELDCALRRQGSQPELRVNAVGAVNDPEVPALRYEDCSLRGDSISAGGSSTPERSLSSKSQRSASTVQTSISTHSTQSQDARGAFRKLGISVRRTFSLHSRGKRSSIAAESPVKEVQAEEVVPTFGPLAESPMEKSYTFVKVARKSARVFVVPFPWMVSKIARVMLNQQFKMLET